MLYSTVRNEGLSAKLRWKGFLMTSFLWTELQQTHNRRYRLVDQPNNSTQCNIYFFALLSALAAFFLSVPRNFLLRFFLCFRRCRDGFSSFFSILIGTLLYSGWHFLPST